METLEIFGTEYADVKGIKAKDSSNNTITYYSPTAFSSTNASKKITGALYLENTGTDLRAHAFEGCTGITSVTAPYLTGTSADGYCFNGCTGITSINMPSATGFGQKCFNGCTGLTTVVLPSGVHCWTYNFSACTNLTGIDFAGTGSGAGTFDTNCFNGSSKLNIVIIRSQTVAKLNNINSFANTPFASGKAGGTLYVPSSLISSYESASNWSTILGYTNNNIAAIEGTTYATHYVDGTTIP